jgi:hypothetical protein
MHESAGLRTARDLMERLSNHGDRHLFRFRDGRPFEGWVLEVGESEVLVTSAGPLATDEPYPIGLEEIDLGTLHYVEDGTLMPFNASLAHLFYELRRVALEATTGRRLHSVLRGTESNSPA